jgi:hypothetical protein
MTVSTRSATVFEVLLDPGVLVERVHCDLDTAGDDPGLEDLRGGGCVTRSHPATGEDQLDLVGAADVEVVGDQGLEKPSCVPGLSEHDGARDLDLAQGDLPPVTGGPVGLGQWQRQDG